MSGPVGSASSSPIEVTFDGRSQPAEALDPARDPTAPRVVLRPANASSESPPTAGMVLGHGGPGFVSGRVTLRGLRVAGFGPRDGGGAAPEVAGGVVAFLVSPSLTIDAGCTFSFEGTVEVNTLHLAAGDYVSNFLCKQRV